MVTTANLPRPKAKAKAKAKARKPRSASQRKPVLQRAPSQAIARVPSLPERIEMVVMEGDLSQLGPQERLLYVKNYCAALGIDWRGRPFAYIMLNGKMVLYALRNCTDQLRRVHGISVTESKRTIEGDLTIFEVKVCDRFGRTDTGTGAWPTQGLKGEAAVNALLKSETKAKRRATLSICGLGMLDESELDTIDDIAGVTPSGRVIEVLPPAGAKEPDCGYCGKMDAPQGCAEPHCPIRNDPAWFQKNAAQRELVISKLKEFSKQQASRTGNPTTSSSAGTAGAANPEATSMGAAPAAKPVLSYVWFDESQTARIDEPKFALPADLKAILKKLVKQGHVAPNGDELEALKWNCQQHGIALCRRYE